MTKIYNLQTQSSGMQTLTYAAEELQRCLALMQAGLPVQVMTCQNYLPDQGGIWLGVFDDVHLPARSAHPLDDEIHVAVENGRGLIAGANPRSVLLAAYRYLAELGCRWLRPGPEGEIIPAADPAARSVYLHECPAYRHRAVCIEGAVSLENVLEMVEWLPRVGLSGYFMQFREGFTFFDRWYRHANNPLKTDEAFSVEQARIFTQQIEQALQKRSLVYHAIGHGWTCEAYDISCLGWEMETGREWPAEFLQDVAEVNGTRAVPWDIVSIAALCYSDPLVQARLADCVADYAATHPQIDLLHVWLDDGFNNKCECSRCRTHRPADDYIEILNAIDTRLTRRGLPHKLVFLSYVDMLWPPETQRLANPDRFVFMFAPISRTYREVMQASQSLPSLPPFERNHLQFPTSIRGLLSFLRGWQTTFSGDSFVYDYHWISHGLYQLDPGQLRLARMASDDIKALKDLGLNGLVNCQLQRVFFPTGLGQYIMARTLWDDSLSFDRLAEEYFDCAFGAGGKRVQAYLAGLGDLLDYGWLAGPGEMTPQAIREHCSAARKLIRRFLPVIRRSMAQPAGTMARSWQILFHHAQVTRFLIQILEARANGQTAQVARHWQALKQYICQHEDELQPVLDVWAFVAAYEKLLQPAGYVTSAPSAA